MNAVYHFQDVIVQLLADNETKALVRSSISTSLRYNKNALGIVIKPTRGEHEVTEHRECVRI
jgi:hypothetical protein